MDSTLTIADRVYANKGMYVTGKIGFNQNGNGILIQDDYIA
jgi:hypothetical protein